MDERILRDFFLDRVTGAGLARDLANSVSHPSAKVSVVHIRDMEESFWVTREMLEKLCDAVLNGKLPSEALKTVGFALIASDRFDWEDDVMTEVISDWACPEIHYPLNRENVERFRRWLTGSEPVPTESFCAEMGSEIVSVTRKKSTKTPRISRILSSVTRRDE